MTLTIGARAMRFDLIEKEAVYTLLVTSGYQCFSDVTDEDLERLLGWVQAIVHRPRRANLYGVLGVSRTANDDEIQQAYRRLAKQYHPDTSTQDTTAAMQQLNDAYAVLGDPQQRQQYDATFTHP